MKKIFLCLALAILSFVSYADVAHIKAFYIDYMTNFSKGIDNYDFDSLWLNSINVIEDRSRYTFSYKMEDHIVKVSIAIINDDGIYKIDSFID